MAEMVAAAAAAAPAEKLVSQDSTLKDSAFHRVTADGDDASSQKDTDTKGHGKELHSMLSGPMLTSTTTHPWDDVRDVPFTQLCNRGSKLTAKNLYNKLMFRYQHTKPSTAISTQGACCAFITGAHCATSFCAQCDLVSSCYYFSRYFLTPLKDLYLPLITAGLPTNFLMVREAAEPKET